MKAMKPLNLLLALVLALALAGCDGNSHHYVPPGEPTPDPAGSWIYSLEGNPEEGTFGDYMESAVECDVPTELSKQCFVAFLAAQGVGIGDITTVWTTPTAPIIAYNMAFGETCWEDWSNNDPFGDVWLYIMELNNGDFLLMEVIELPGPPIEKWEILAYVPNYSLLEDGGNVDFGSVLAIEDCSDPYEANILLRLERGDVFTPNMCP